MLNLIRKRGSRNKKLYILLFGLLFLVFPGSYADSSIQDEIGPLNASKFGFSDKIIYARLVCNRRIHITFYLAARSLMQVYRSIKGNILFPGREHIEIGLDIEVFDSDGLLLSIKQMRMSYITWSLIS